MRLNTKRNHTNLNVFRRRAGGFHLLRYGWIWLGALALLWGAGARNRPRNAREESRPPLSPLRSERNILLNGGFEEGLQNWTYTGERVDDPSQAHSGRACVTGEVKQPNQAQFLRQKVTLRTDARYRLQLWARGTNQTKIAVWLRQGKRRWNLSQLENIPVRWQEFVVPFSAPNVGALELELVAPSSHNAPPGRVWVDDVALYEMVLPPAVSLTAPAEVADFPALASDGQGRLYTAWVEFKEGKERLWLASGRAEGDKLIWDARGEVPLPGESVESASLAGDADGAWGCAAVETPQGWDLLAFRAGRNGLMDKPWLLMQDAATDIRPALAVSGSRAAVVWESNRDGKRQIYAAALESGKTVTPQCLSDGSDSCYFPTITGDGNGHLWAAWEQFVRGQYDIVMAHFNGATWDAPRRLTQNPYLEHRPSLAWTPLGVWVAWEAVEFPAYRTSSSTWQRVLTARIGNAGLELPANVWDALPLWGTNPRLLQGRDGRLYLVVRHSQGQGAGWEVFLFAFDGHRWQGPESLTAQTGRNRAVPIAQTGDRLWAAAQLDNITRRWESVKESLNFRSEVRLISFDTSALPAVQPTQLEALHLPETTFNPQVIREQRGEERERFSIAYNGKRLNLYFGQFHEHSEISQCNRRGDLPPDDNYTLNRDIHRLDFSALTDHGYNLAPPIWAYTAKLNRWQEDPGRFLTFLAEEWTSTFERYTDKHPQGFYGHRNLIFADARLPRWLNAQDKSTPADVWATLRKERANFVQIPHQLADTGNVPTDWDFVDEEAQPLAEVFQTRGSYEYDGTPRQAKNTVAGHFIQNAWAKGVIIGVIASPDHGGGMGKAAVFAPELTRDAILDACRARHTYGTTGAKIFLDVRVNGRLMGEKLPLTTQPVQVDVRVSAPADIEAVEVCKNNRFVYTRAGGGKDVTFTFRDSEPPRDGTYYYVRVRQQDGEIAWSSPVWFFDKAKLNEKQHREGVREMWE